MEQFYKCIHSMFFYIGWDIVKEIIILDNGSDQKELLQFLKQLDKQVEKINVIFSDVNLGVAKGRKQLFDIATGDYIVSLDSDVIVINPPLLLKTIQTALELEDMYLVGGGGSDFPYWPSIEMEDIVTKDIPDEGKYTIVDDVAGWFHAFKSANLTKNGGELYMDEQFSPFWAEDSDFSFQVKQIGKKSCILGHGLIFHAWSSCDKPETRITADTMWEKLKNKWYKINNLSNV
jgi:GT2 family glycosyltransferase